MLYFIPAWYQDDQWSEHEEYWYYKREYSEFDDTVKQIQLFHRNQTYPFNVLLLGYTPNLRHFLHRQGVFRIPYWSCFDAIQEVKRKKAVVLSYHQINWPDNIEFVYSPFLIVAKLNGKKYAEIEFGENGNPIQIAMFEGDTISRRNIYDDRGFVSSAIIYEAGERVYQEYYMENGVWKMRHFYTDGHIQMNPKYAQFRIEFGDREETVPFARENYERLEQLIEEVTRAYLYYTNKKDMFCIAMHMQHANLLRRVLKERKVILSFYLDRYPLEKGKVMLEQLIDQAGYMVVDTKAGVARLRKYVHDQTPIIDISPYDTRINLGVSQQLTVQQLLIPIDGMNEEMFTEMVLILLEYKQSHENVELHFLTRKAQQNYPQIVLDKIEKLLKANEDDIDEIEMIEDDLNPDKETHPMEGVLVHQCVDEQSISKVMTEQRLLLELRDEPELYLQIVAISSGIPQIVRKITQFVESGKNGKVIGDLRMLPDTLDYYLDGLGNWNAAMVQSIELGKNYTTENLIHSWKEVISSFE